MSFNPGIDENYFARTERNTENLFTFHISIYTLIFYIVGFIITVTMTVLMLWIYYNIKQMDICKKSKSNVFSIAFTAGILMLYMLALDIAAVVTLKDKTPILNDRNIDDNNLPYIVLFIDAAMAVLWGVCWILTFVSSSKCTCSNRCSSCNGKQYLLQAILTVGPIFMMVSHLPYIAISYLNDASYASSIFIYYTVVAFVIFCSLDLAYRTFQKAISDVKRSNTKRNLNLNVQQTVEGYSDSDKLISTDDGQSSMDACIFPFCKKKHVFKCCIWGSTIAIFMLFLLILIGMTTAALVVVPISRTFSDAPNRLLGFYETVIVVTGAYLAYKGIFRKKITLEAAVKKRMQHIRHKGNDDDWQHFSDDEKIAVFYDFVVELVAKLHPEQSELDTREGKTKEGGKSKDHDEVNKQGGSTVRVPVYKEPGNEGNTGPNDSLRVAAEGDKYGGDSGVHP